jgi:excinuclease ABC subunit A
MQKVRTHNLKGFDAEIPLSKYTVVTGVSGSGKSSLVFDTLYGESYRRYVESLSSYARQYLKALPRPAVEEVENLPASIAVQQSRQGQSNRSTVGTMTELLDVLRILYTHLSDIVCCGHIIRKDNGESISRELLAENGPGEAARVLVLAPLAAWKHLKAKDLKAHLEAQGFSRAFVDGEVVRIEKTTAKALREGYVIVDRVQVEAANHRRLADSIDLALRLGRGTMVIHAPDSHWERAFNSALKCPSCETLYHEPSLSLFNFNHPLGACESCQGFGRVPRLDPAKVIPDTEQSLATKGVAAWNFGQHVAYYREAWKSAENHGIDLDRPFSSYTKDEWDWLFFGDADGRFGGIEGYFAWLDRKKYKPHYRIHAARFRKYVVCPDCAGRRLKPEALHCLIDGRHIAELCEITLDQLQEWFKKLSQDGQEGTGRHSKLAMGAREAIDEGLVRLRYLRKIGLGYLSLNRLTKSLSGGESQRLQMARSLGNALTATLFCLDEPSSGLHPRDSHNLLGVILELRDQGNTVVVVEHEKVLIDGADHLIEIGPEAGHKGGELIHAGSTAQRQPATVPFEWSPWQSTDSTKFLKLSGARTLNLKNITAQIPFEALTVVCGVSGSGKTSLVQHTLYPLVARVLGHQVDNLAVEPEAQRVSPLAQIRQWQDCVLVSQEGIGRSTRSTIATYLDLYGEIRQRYAQTRLAKARKLKPGYFSFNVAGGRCETCKGLGTIDEDLSFLGEMTVNCPDCAGKRFREEALEITYRDKSILDVLQMTVGEAREFFFDDPGLVARLDIVMTMGLGYLTLGQHTSSFSGGEAQRLKMAKFLLEKRRDGPRLFIFDEPTTGLSDQDVSQLLRQLRLLIDEGHTVIVIEHHLGVIKAADWLLEVGPDAAAAGGELVFAGRPVDLLGKNTETARFLK